MVNGNIANRNFYHLLIVLISVLLCILSVALCIFYTNQRYNDIHERVVQLEKELSELRYRKSSPHIGNWSAVDSEARSHYSKEHFVNKRSIEDELREKNDEIRRLGNTISSLQREMFSLNDRLRVLISYGDNGGKETHCQGLPGPPGREGPEGPRGPPGQNGRSGFPGTKGSRGQKGVRGKAGDDGKDGRNGLNGIPGLPGPPGRKGDKGERGRNGVDGRNGRIGATGLPGLPGQPGAPGRAGMKGQRGECSVLTFNKYKEYATQYLGETSQSITYTIWGSASCPPSGEAIFSGQLSMGRFAQEDGSFIGSGPMCIPKSYNSRRRFKRDLSFIIKHTEPKFSAKKNSSQKANHSKHSKLNSYMSSTPSKIVRYSRHSSSLTIQSQISKNVRKQRVYSSFSSSTMRRNLIDQNSRNLITSSMQIDRRSSFLSINRNVVNSKSKDKNSQSPRSSKTMYFEYNTSIKPTNSKSIKFESSRQNSKPLATSFSKTQTHGFSTMISASQTDKIALSSATPTEDIAHTSITKTANVEHKRVIEVISPIKIRNNRNSGQYKAGELKVQEIDVFNSSTLNDTNGTSVNSNDTSSHSHGTSPGILGGPTTNLVDEPDENSAENKGSTLNNTNDTSNKIPPVVGPTSSPNDEERKHGYIESTRKYISCAVCQFTGKSSIIMIPARIQCPATWKVEYRGYLMMYHHGTEQATSICVNDQALGVSPSSDRQVRNIISQYLKHLHFDCNSFACPPFYDDLVRCVVCSK